MLNKILSFSLNNRLIVLLGATVLAVVGVNITRTMNVDVFPDLTAPTVAILTEAHGMETEEVEKLVTFQIETAMNGSPNVRRIRSSSTVGFSIVWVEFEWGTDIYRARQIVSERIPMVQEKLPMGVQTPTMAPISSIMGEIMLVAVTSDSLSPMEIRTLADWTISPRLKSVGGVANVSAIGGDYKQYQVLVHPEKLKYYHLNIKDLADKVAESNLNVAGGLLNEYGNQYVIKGSGRTYHINDLEESIVKQVNGQNIKIKDVATVVVGVPDKIGEGSLNASPSVILTITKQPDVNTLELTNRLQEAVNEMQLSLPPRVTLHSDIFKQSNKIRSNMYWAHIYQS